METTQKLTGGMQDRWRILIAAGILLSGSLAVLSRGPVPQVKRHSPLCEVSAPAVLCVHHESDSVIASEEITHALAEVSDGGVENLRSFRAVQMVEETHSQDSLLASTTPAWFTGNVEE